MIRSILDFMQIMLSQSSCVQYVTVPILVLMIMQIWKLRKIPIDLIRLIRKVIRRYVLKIYWKNFFVLIVSSFFLVAFSTPAHDVIQYIETRWIYPVKKGSYNFVGDEMLKTLYEAEIQKHVDPLQLDTLIKWTEFTAARIGCSPVRIYECALLENGLKPFKVRNDEVAAGWIQFTRRGLKSTGVTLEQVINMCRLKQITPIMELTDLYLYQKYKKSGGKPLTQMIDVYLAIFAPVFVGRDGSQVVYSGYDNPNYYKNSGLDGWVVIDGKIVRGAKDGRIQIDEIALCLERKKLVFLKERLDRNVIWSFQN